MIEFDMKIAIKFYFKDKKKESDYLKEFKSFANEQFKELSKRKLKFPISIYHL